MQQAVITLPEIKLVGVTVRTCNKDEANIPTGKILPCVQKYFHHFMANKIHNRKKPGTTSARV